MWDDAGYVLASNYRKIIFEKLAEKNYLPHILVEETRMKFSHISRSLNELKSKNLVKCLNEDSKKGRIYSITNYGKKIYKVIKEEM